MHNFSSFARVLQFALLSSLGAMSHDGVVVEVVSLDDIRILAYFSEDAKDTSSIKRWSQAFLERNKFKIGGIASDLVNVSFSVSCSEEVMECFLRNHQ